MDIDIREEPITTISEYAGVAIAFEIHSVLDIAVQDDGVAVAVLAERALEVPYVKDYDALRGQHPSNWATSFDLSNWGLLTARSSGRRVGGAVIAFNTPGVTMLDDRSDLAVLWDLRVAPDVRHEGIGSTLFCAVAAWGAARGCRDLKVETQNTNVAACRFYERQGCVLGSIRRFAYPELPDEIQLLWYKDLSHLSASAGPT